MQDTPISTENTYSANNADYAACEQSLLSTAERVINEKEPGEDTRSPIELLLCGNDKVVPGVTLCILSIAKNTRRQINLHLGTADITYLNDNFRPLTHEMCADIEYILKLANPKSTLEVIDFSEDFRRELNGNKNADSSYTPYTMARLFAPKINITGNKLLYLDTDVMALGDISEFYDTDISKYHLAGVRDYFGKFFYGLSYGSKYFNAGVLLFNMARMKHDKIFEKCLKLCHDKKMMLFDQAALNKCVHRRLILPRRFNEQRETMPDTLIRHFAKTIHFLPYFHTENIKPWQPDLVREKLKDNRFDDVFGYYEIIKEEKFKKDKICK